MCTSHQRHYGFSKVLTLLLQELDALPDPCPLPGQDESGGPAKRKGLRDKERLLHAPMSDAGGLLYDKDAVYIDIPDWKVQYSHATASGAAVAHEGEDMVRQLAGTRETVDEKLKKSDIQLFEGVRVGDVDEDDEDDDDDDDISDDVDAESVSEDDESTSEDDESDDESDARDETTIQLLAGRPKGSTRGAAEPSSQDVLHNGRVRRRAVFQEGSGGFRAEGANGKSDAGDGYAQYDSGHDAEDEDDDINDDEGELGAPQPLLLLKGLKVMTTVA